MQNDIQNENLPENKNPYSKVKAELVRKTERTKTRLKKEINRAVKKISRKRSRKIKYIIAISIVALYALFSLVITLNEKFFKIKAIPEWHELYEMSGFSSSAYKGVHGDVAVHFIDVEQGDCSLIIAGDYTVLIDAGELSEKSTVITYLRSLDIEHLDMVIASHPHSDHIGSLGAVINKYGTDVLLMPDVSEEMTPITSSYENMIEAADKCGADIRFAAFGDVYTLMEGCTLEIIAPVKDYEDHNNYSIVCRLSYGENEFLFTGDIEELAERDIVDSGADISSDVIKVAHHGSNTSSLKVFMQAVDPDYALISVGSPNDYGHPHDETLELLGLLDIKVYRTDLNGDVVMFTDGKEITVVTQKDRGEKIADS